MSDAFSSRILSLARGFAYNVASIVLWLVMLPGGIQLLTGWGLLPRVVELVLALLLVSALALISSWSLGWLHKRCVRTNRPGWVTSPLARALLVMATVTCIVATPLAFSSEPVIQLATLLVPPAIGFGAACNWTAVWFYLHRQGVKE